MDGLILDRYSYASDARIWSASRIPSATIVNVGFAYPTVGNTELPKAARLPPLVLSLHRLDLRVPLAHADGFGVAAALTRSAALGADLLDVEFGQG